MSRKAAVLAIVGGILGFVTGRFVVTSRPEASFPNPQVYGHFSLLSKYWVSYVLKMAAGLSLCAALIGLILPHRAALVTLLVASPVAYFVLVDAARFRGGGYGGFGLENAMMMGALTVFFVSELLFMVVLARVLWRYHRAFRRVYDDAMRG